MIIALVQIILGIILFFIINWIGKHSFSIGYMEISLFVKTEEAPALNFLIRVFTPIVYLIIISAILYYFNLDKYVENIFFVNIYYVLFRLLFNLVTNRGLLLNWYRQLLYWSAIILISYVVYEKLIKSKINILPDFTTIANELWIIILVFIFQLTNNIRLSQTGTVVRKQKYLKSRYYYFKKLYGKLIADKTQNHELEALVFSIIIYEDFNRPKIIRIIENIKTLFTNKTLTLGVMQVKSKRKISDIESVSIGTTKIVYAYKKYLNQLLIENEDYYEVFAYRAIISDFNGGESYESEITELTTNIKDLFYKHSNDSLNPIKS